MRSRGWWLGGLLAFVAGLAVPLFSQGQAPGTGGASQPAHVICDSGCGGGGGGGGAVTVADGADVTQGNTADAAVTGDNAGTISAKLRGLNKAIAAGLSVVGTDQTLADTFNAGHTGPTTFATPGGGMVHMEVTTSGGPAGANLFVEVLVAGTWFPAEGLAFGGFLTNPVQNFFHIYTGSVGPTFFQNGTTNFVWWMATGTQMRVSTTAPLGSGAFIIAADFKPMATAPLSGTVIVGQQTGLSADVTSDNKLQVSVTRPGDGTPVLLINADGQTPAGSIYTPPWGALPYFFNGATWDRARGDATSGLWTNLKSAAQLPAVLVGGRLDVLATQNGAPWSVSQSGTWTVRLNDSAGAAWTIGQQLAAASMPVILPAATIATLTPPAAITGFALEAGHLASLDTKLPAQGQALAAASLPVVLTAAQLTTLTPLSTVTVTQATPANLQVTDTQGNAGSNAQAWWMRIGDTTNGPVSVGTARPAAAAAGLTVRSLMPTNGTQDMPTMDAVARPGFQALTDGSNGPVGVKPSSTAPGFGDTALVVSLSPNSVPPSVLSATTTFVGSTSSEVFLLGSNSSRKGAQICNQSAKVLLVKLGANIDSRSYTRMLRSGECYDIANSGGVVNGGVISGLWLGFDGGGAVVVEM